LRAAADQECPTGDAAGLNILDAAVADSGRNGEAGVILDTVEEDRG
jgi:hypothetical protein